MRDSFMQIKQPKKVYLKLSKNSWFVRYSERAPRGRFLAACFDAKDWSRERVETWVKNKARLELVQSPDEAI